MKEAIIAELVLEYQLIVLEKDCRTGSADLHVRRLR
jgi:hypothetical protein